MPGVVSNGTLKMSLPRLASHNAGTLDCESGVSSPPKITFMLGWFVKVPERFIIVILGEKARVNSGTLVDILTMSVLLAPDHGKLCIKEE